MSEREETADPPTVGDEEAEAPVSSPPRNPLDVPTGALPPVLDDEPVDPRDVPTGALPSVDGDDPADVPTGAVGPVDADGAGAHEPPASGSGEIIVLSDRPTPPVAADAHRSGRRPRRDWVDLVDRWYPERYRLPTIATTAVALGLTVAYLYFPTAGTDLAARVARGHFFTAHGALPVDFRWYGGTYPFGASAFAGPLNALAGARVVGGVSAVVASVAFAWLLARHRVRRPTVGGVLAAMVGACNLVSGRTTFALGLAVALTALVAASLPQMRPRRRLLLTGVLAALSTMCSPLAGLFVGVAGGAVLLAGPRRRAEPAGTTEVADRAYRAAEGGWWRRWWARRGVATGTGLALCLGALAGVAPLLVFDDGGVQPFTLDSMKVFIAVVVAVFVLVPSGHRVLRVGAVLLIALTIAAYLVPSPLGSNVTELPMLYAAPLVAAVSALDRRLVAGAIVALIWWQPPLVFDDVSMAGDRASQEAFYQPLVDELRTNGPVGRVEVVPLYNHWGATYVGEVLPLARGADRQVDVGRNPLFYADDLAPDTYLAWLYRNAVSFVAVPNDAKLDRYGRLEQSLINARPQYLKKTWSNPDWTLYRVVGAQHLVSGAGRLVDSGPTGVVFDTETSGKLTVRVRWSRWLTLSGPGACLRPGPDHWVQVQVSDPGRYTISSGWHLRQTDAC